MTNYNDGKWHGWNGGECPVHPKSIVRVVWTNGLDVGAVDGSAGAIDEWGGEAIAFRVIKEHKEPREFWLVEESCFTTKDNAELYCNGAYGYTHPPIIHVREVLE